MGDHHINHIEQIFKALKESWEVIHPIQSETNIYICMLQLCTLAQEAADRLKKLDVQLMDKLPEELSPERVDGWIDLIEARKSIPDWVWIDFSEPEAGRGFARQLNHFLPRTLKLNRSLYSGRRRWRCFRGKKWMTAQPSTAATESWRIRLISCSKPSTRS